MLTVVTRERCSAEDFKNRGKTKFGSICFCNFFHYLLSLFEYFSMFSFVHDHVISRASMLRELIFVSKMTEIMQKVSQICQVSMGTNGSCKTMKFYSRIFCQFSATLHEYRGNFVFVLDKKSVTEIDGSPPLTPSSPFIRSYTGSHLDNKDSASMYHN